MSAYTKIRGRIRAKLDAEPILLSHHPMCGRFEDHVFRIRGRAACIGCFSVYPSAAITLAALAALGINSFDVLLLIAAVPFLLNLPRIAIKKNRALSVIFNVLLGISLAGSILCAIRAPENIRAQFLFFAIGTASVFVFMKGLLVFLACRRCPDFSKFPACQTRNSR